MTEQTLDATGIYAKWNAPKAKAATTTDPDAEAQAAVEQTDAKPDTSQDFLTGDPDEPFNTAAIYNKWNGSV